jgi:myo-inositol-1(or 4)-monophosphatase
MHGRRLATTEQIIALLSPSAGEQFDRLEAWADEKGLDVTAVGLEESVEDVHDPEQSTLGVTLGGDGTFLEGIKRFTPRGIPQLGVNAGTLAFLARVELEDMEQALDEAVRGRATIDSRQMVAVEGSGLDTTGINDVMIQNVPPENPFDRKVTTLDVFVDGEYVGEYEGNGIAVSTPTGSTGISLSANGPVHVPANNHTLQIVPLQTHSLGVRPLVVSADADIKVVTGEQASLLVDGGRVQKMLAGDEVVHLTGASERADVVQTSYDDQFMAAVASKLGWGLREGTDDGPRDLLAPETPDPDPSTVERARTVAKEAAQSAGEPLRELHGRVEDVTYKTDKSDIVTEADHQANRIITTVIENEFPNHSILSEESEFREGSADYTWVIDPLDGTGNFAHGNPQYSVSIGMLEGSDPVMGVVYVPETDELFHAVAGGDAYQGDTPIHTTDRDALDESMLLSGWDPDGDFLTHFYGKTQGVRALGSAALSLCYLASGSADGSWEYGTYPWDVAAGLVIARAAGARLTDCRGDPYTLTYDTDKRKELLASNGPLHSALLSHVQESENLV